MLQHVALLHVGDVAQGQPLHTLMPDNQPGEENRSRDNIQTE